MDGHIAFRLKLPNGATIEFEGDKEYVDSKIPEWEKIEALVNATAPVKPPHASQTPPQKEPTIEKNIESTLKSESDYSGEELRTYLNEYEIKNSPQIQVAAFAYFLQILKGWGEVSYEQLEECFSLAGLRIPEVKKAVSNSERRFRLVERQKSGSVSITRIGRNFIEDKGRTDPARVNRNNNKTFSNPQSANVKKKLPIVVKIKGDLDLFGGGGRESLSEFAEKIDPESTVNRFAVSAYYLTQILNQEDFDESDLYTCLQYMKWKSPSYLRNNIINHKNQHGFYSILASGRFAVTMKLKNYVEELIASDKLSNSELQLDQ